MLINLKLHIFDGLVATILTCKMLNVTLTPCSHRNIARTRDSVLKKKNIIILLVRFRECSANAFKENVSFFSTLSPVRAILRCERGVTVFPVIIREFEELVPVFLTCRLQSALAIRWLNRVMNLSTVVPPIDFDLVNL